MAEVWKIRKAGKKMKKIFCDRCGKEIEGLVLSDISQAAQLISGIRYTLTSRFGIGDAKQYDLCPDCQSDLYDWLNDGAKEE